MSRRTFEEHYPRICEMLAATPFEEEMHRASRLEPDDFRRTLQRNEFTFNGLMSLFCGAVIPEWREVRGDELEKDLSAVIAALGSEKAATAYREKLLTKSENALEDVRYEIAVTARACAVLDRGSVELERPIDDPRVQNPKHRKNSDIYGTFQEQPVRIEVTVLHERPPDSIDPELVDYVEKTPIDSGFTLTLRSVIKDQAAADHVRGLIESLHSHDTASGGASVKVGDLHFNWSGGVYVSSEASSPIERIRFCRAGDLRGGPETREIQHLGQVRPVTPRYIREENPLPKGVIDVFDTASAPQGEPVSKKVRDAVEKKLKQCEPGIVNIVALGNPQARHDDEVVNALKGAVIPFVQYAEDEHGNRFIGDVHVSRAIKAPFNPAEEFANDEEREQFVNHFRDLSAVWHLRIGSYRKSEVFPNPNAKVPLPDELGAALL